MSIRKGTTIIAGNSSPLDWTGTLQEYNIALENGTIKENMVCYITDDTLYTDDIRPEIDRLDNVKANKDLSNLSEVGEKHFLNKSQITNCITEVPQRIKLELNNGVLTLKAGSDVIVPNGFEADGTTPKFDYVTIESDTTFQGTSTQTGSFIVSLNADTRKIGWNNGANAGSGTATTSTSGFYYRTDLNEIYYKNDTSTSKYCFPFCFVNISSGAITSIDQVFNGFGYIGSTIWVDKGVKGLIPNGRNEDGTLNNIEFVTGKVMTTTNPANTNKTLAIKINNNGISRINTSLYKYNSEENLNYDGENDAYFSAIICADYTRNLGVVDSFNPKLPFRAVDYNDKSEITGWSMSSNKYIDLTLGASGTTYIAPANGWYSVDLASVSTSSFGEFYKNGVRIAHRVHSVSNQSIPFYAPFRKGDILDIKYSNATLLHFRFYYAEGEV